MKYKFKKGDRIISRFGHCGFIDKIIPYKFNGYKVYWTMDSYGCPVFDEGPRYMRENQIELDLQWYREERLKKLLG